MDLNAKIIIVKIYFHHQHHHERLGKYRLEDEELTHLGQSLGEIDKFDDVQLSDDDDNDNNNEDGGKMEMFIGLFQTSCYCHAELKSI